MGITPVVATNVLRSPVVDTSNGMATPQWVDWFQRISTAVNAGMTLVGTALKLPFPTIGTLGGVQANTPVAGQWVNQIDAFGVPHLSQPTTSDIQGLGTGAITATSATAGGASALPATPASYLVLNINGTLYKVALYAV